MYTVVQSGTFRDWLAGLLACWLAGLLACWLAGLLACWLAGLLACWLAGLLACWLAGLRDVLARARINARIRRAELGNLGDVKSVGLGVSEIRIDHGPGYRVYFTQRDQMLIVLLCGGDKRTQASDIKRSQRMARQL
jgi:putative addiction module killer protein